MKQDFVCGQQRSRSWPDVVHTMCMKLAVHLTTNSSPSVHEAMQLVPPPPFILQIGKHLYTTWTPGVLQLHAIYTVSKSGWMEERDYLKRFQLHLYLSISISLSKASSVLFDGHFSHMSISLIKIAHPLLPLLTPQYHSHPAALGHQCI